MRLAIGSIITALVAVATAYTQPNYNQPPTGNAILKPGLNEQVPAGKPYTITWTPTTKGQISLVLLRGPSTNVKPLATIVEDIPNSGQYVWTPSTTLEPDVTHYGILLVVEGTGQYQYSTQFGISNPNYQSGSTTSQSSQQQTATTTATVIPASTSDVTVVTTETTTECPVSSSTAAPTTAPASTSSVPVIPTSPVVPPSSAAKPTTMQTVTSVVVVPSSPSVPSSGSGSGNPPSTPPAAPSTPSGPVFTGSGNRNALSMGAVAAAAFAVLAF